MLFALADISSVAPVLFPIHPRTRKRLLESDFNPLNQNGLRLMEPLPYIAFLELQKQATLVITDSGGIQEETTFLGTPCLTVRENTEWPVTVEIGTNILVGRDVNRLRFEVEQILSGNRKSGRVPFLWDGHGAERIARVITNAR